MNTHVVHPAERDAGRAQEARAGDFGELRAFANALARQKYLILGAILVLGAVSAVIAWWIPGRYRSEVTVLVQPAGNLSDPNSMSTQAPPEIVRSQLEVVQSPSVIERVVDKLGLMDDTEFAPARATQFDHADTRRAIVIANVAKRLKVDNDGRSVTIHISFEANSPRKAEQITDEIANEYIRAQGQLKNKAVQATKDRLENRLADLRLDAQQAEQAAEDFRRSANLVWLSAGSGTDESLGGTTYTSRLLDQFSRQAADTSAAAAQAGARAQAANGDMARTGGASTPEALSSAIVTSLLQQDAELAKAESAMTPRYTGTYPPLAQIRAQRAKLRSTLAATRRNIQQSLNIQASGAQAVDRAASARAQALEGLVNQQIGDTVHYRQLQREALIKRKTYEDFASQSRTISERSLLQMPDALLVAPASLPIRESRPNRPVLFLIGIIGALVAGCSLALLREFRFATRRSI